MVSPCIVHLCQNIGTHRFPKNEVRRTLWIRSIKYIKPRLSIRKSSLICSAHFRPTDFAITPKWFTKPEHAQKRLKKTAIPSVFPWNRASQEQPSSSQDSTVFDPTKVDRTYSRTPPIKFVEELPFLNTVTSDVIEDPLQCSNQEAEDIVYRYSDQETGH